MNARSVQWVVAGVGLAALFTAIVVVVPHIDNLLSRQKFDAEHWRSGGSTEANLQIRLHMVHDLIENYTLAGMRKNEIEDLLGTADSESSKHLRYDLGPTGSGIDHGTLSLKMKDGVVVGYSVSGH